MKISLYKIIRNEEYDAEKMEIVEMFDRETRQKLYDEIKAWVAGTARGNRRYRIWNTSIGAVKLWGILDRLTIDTETLKVDYCCGQEWNSEMAILRDAFD